MYWRAHDGREQKGFFGKVPCSAFVIKLDYVYFLTTCRLSLTDFYHIEDKESEASFARLLKCSPNLSEIYFNVISREMFKSIACHCGPNLRIINAKSIDYDSRDEVKAIFKVCTNLSVLRDSSQAYLHTPGDEVILTAVQYCPLIEVLPTHVWHLTDVAMNALATIHTLKELKLFDHYESCSSAAIQRVLHSNLLESIDLQGSLVDDALVKCMSTYCGNLKRLELTKLEYFGISTEAYVDLFRGCPLLKECKLEEPGGMSSEALSALFQFCPNLTSLNLRWYPSETTQFGHPLVFTPTTTTSTPSLRKLKIYGRCISYNALRDICTYCINLQKVSLFNCVHVTDDMIKILIQYCNKLKVITIGTCDHVTLTGLSFIATYCTTLTGIRLSKLPIDDDVLILLSTYCHNLDVIALESCEGVITEVGILSIIHKCMLLTCMRISCIDLNITPMIESLINGEMYTHIDFDIRC